MENGAGRMNRKQRRHDPNSKKKYSLVDVQKATNLAITMKKFTKGHLYKENLKDKCLFCGSSTKTKKECIYWFLTFMDRMQTALINPSFFTDKEIQALWLQHGDEYQNIKLPLNVTDVTKKD